MVLYYVDPNFFEVSTMVVRNLQHFIHGNPLTICFNLIPEILYQLYLSTVREFIHLCCFKNVKKAKIYANVRNFCWKAYVLSTLISGFKKYLVLKRSQFSLSYPLLIFHGSTWKCWLVLYHVVWKMNITIKMFVYMKRYCNQLYLSLTVNFWGARIWYFCLIM